MAAIQNVVGPYVSFSRLNRSLDPFWATRLWQHLIQHAKGSIKVKRHRYLFKVYDNVFTGANMVDAIYNCLSNCASHIVTQHVTRIHVSKVCQVLMDSGLFEDVTQKYEARFEDSTSHFYRFTNEENRDVIVGNQFSNCNKENQGILNPVDTLTSAVPEIMNIGDSTKNEAIDVHMARIRDRLSQATVNTPRHFTLPKPRRHSLSPHTNNNSNVAQSKSREMYFIRKGNRSSMLKMKRFEIKENVQLMSSIKPLPDGITEEVHSTYKERALVHLLTLVDVPILESILSIPSSLLKLFPVTQQLTIRNNEGKGPNIELSSKYGNINNIPWVAAAKNCLGKVPDRVGHLWSLQACKILCYQSVVEYYSNISGTIIPLPLVCICTGIIEMLRQDMRTKALLASQLLMLVLPWQRSRQLHYLLKFLQLVVGDIFVSVDKKVTNYEAVSRDFLRTVLSHPCVSKENCQILFDFLLFRVDQIFQISNCLQHLRKENITFCKQVKVREFYHHSSDFTEQSLKELAYTIMDSTTFKLNEKRNWMKKFKKTHPQIYKECSLGD